MQQYGIKKLLDIPNYAITKIVNTDKEITVWLEPYQRNKAKCVACSLKFPRFMQFKTPQFGV